LISRRAELIFQQCLPGSHSLHPSSHESAASHTHMKNVSPTSTNHEAGAEGPVWPTMAPAIPWPINTTYTQSGSMPDVTHPSRSNPLPDPGRPCSVIGVWPQLAACSLPVLFVSRLRLSLPYPCDPAYSAVQVQGFRRPLGSGSALHRSGLRAPVGTGQSGSVPLRRRAAAPRQPERRTPGARCQWPSPSPRSPPRGLRGCAPAAVPSPHCGTATDHRWLPSWHLGCSTAPPISCRSEDCWLTDR
jgi:hypothetical protein